MAGTNRPVLETKDLVETLKIDWYYTTGQYHHVNNPVQGNKQKVMRKTNAKRIDS